MESDPFQAADPQGRAAASAATLGVDANLSPSSLADSGFSRERESRVGTLAACRSLSPSAGYPSATDRSRR